MPGQDPSFPDFQELPIFPLPNVVFFPRTVLPLHIFEPRYKQMVADALEGNRQIGMALLQRGWGSGQDESPEVFNVGGMGLITQHEHLEEGLEPVKKLKVRAVDQEGTEKRFHVITRIDTPNEVIYYQNGGILHYVLRSLRS